MIVLVPPSPLKGAGGNGAVEGDVTVEGEFVEAGGLAAAAGTDDGVVDAAIGEACAARGSWNGTELTLWRLRKSELWITGCCGVAAGAGAAEAAGSGAGATTGAVRAAGVGAPAGAVCGANGVFPAGILGFGKLVASLICTHSIMF